MCAAEEHLGLAERTFTDLGFEGEGVAGEWLSEMFILL